MAAVEPDAGIDAEASAVLPPDPCGTRSRWRKNPCLSALAEVVYNRHIMPKVKICGLTNEPDARVVRAAGADYVGCVVGVPASPRNVSPETAQAVFAAAGGK